MLGLQAASCSPSPGEWAVDHVGAAPPFMGALGLTSQCVTKRHRAAERKLSEPGVGLTSRTSGFSLGTGFVTEGWLDD